MRVELQEVTVYYEGHFVPALSAVSFTVPEGAFAVLTGPTGSGKTTTLRLLYRELSPQSGSVWVDGMKLAQLPFRELQRLRRQMGIVFQDCRLLPCETAYENVLLPLLARGVPTRQAQAMVLELFAELGISYLRHKRPAALSGGEQQLVAIARALLPRPRLLLADEPTGNVEPATTAHIAELFRRVHAQGTTVLVATHSADLLALLPATLRIELQDGHVVRITTAEPQSGSGP
ncbi:MAG: ATP-binding cassette domain-containing protein [Candidatus Kapabacteria bacterium]|nr:ATP-binding cassette domain-containing protein [Candidatus Kapabacteria bacterium]MDW8012571.1 ATP-binding cassette domain-containing protein [Bacteroidota bacterium]